MIQRIQSVYLFLTSVFFFCYWFFGLQWYEKGYPLIMKLFNNLELIETVLILISYIPLIISFLALVTIFLFKKRDLQIKVTLICLRFSLFMSLFTVFYFYNCLTYLTEIMPSQVLEFLMYAAILNPFICTYLLFLALKSIKTDNELVNSLNRIR